MTEAELQYIRLNYGVKTLQEIADDLEITLNKLYRTVKKYKFKKQPVQLWYAIYKKDEFYFMAPASACCRRLGISRNTLDFYTTQKHIERIYSKEELQKSSRTIAVKLGSFPVYEETYYKKLKKVNQKLFGEGYYSEAQ